MIKKIGATGLLILFLAASVRVSSGEGNIWADTGLPYPAVPDGLQKSFEQAGLGKSHDLVFDAVNPFYLCADFDGDGKRDYAVNVRRRGDDRPGMYEIVILRANGKVNWLKEDTKRVGFPGPIWWVLYKDERKKIRFDGESPVPNLVGDGFVIESYASASALVFWNGKKFDLYWQSD